MGIRDLTHDQQLALVALTEATAIADKDLSNGEVDQIGEIAEELGEEHYRRLLDEAEQRFPDDSSLKHFLETISDAHARELIFDHVLRESLSSASPERSQRDPLQWLIELWQIDYKVGAEEP